MTTAEWVGFNPGRTENKAPTRLSSATHRLARRYLSGEIGRTMRDVAAWNAEAGDPARRLAIPDDFYLALPSAARLYARAVREIAEKAPLRLDPGERLAGAATLAEAAGHTVPVLGIPSISHTTLGFERALALGYDGLRDEILARLDAGDLDADGVDLLEAMLDVIQSARIWKERYRAEAERLGLAEVARTLARVPEQPPSSFREAVQALWLLWDFQRLCGNWSGLGRVDKMLGPFLARDLAEGRIDRDEAREWLAHFWIKGCEWITGEARSGGDAQFYQNVILAGVDEDGRDLPLDVAHLVLDVVEELHIADFPIAVRLSSRTPESFLRRVAEVQRRGGGIVAVYNEDRIIDALTCFGYPLREARNFTNDGCWEILIPGKTAFSYQAFDAVPILQATLGLATPPGSTEPAPAAATTPEYASFDALHADFRRRFARALTEHVNRNHYDRTLPTVLVDLLVEGCVEKGRSYYNGGPRYTVISPHPGGLPDVANSLAALERRVYRDKTCTLADMAQWLRDDWAGHETERLAWRTRGAFYGNDDEEADRFLRLVYDDYTELMARVRQRMGALRPAGISTFGREANTFLPGRTASPAGTRRGDVLATNFSPAPGTDRKGATAVIRSHCAVDYARLPCGTALELKIATSALEGEAGLASLASLMRAFVALGGLFMQIDVVDTELLRRAQERPEEYANLAVRISGWSARFATLSREWQDMIIQRSEHRE